MRVELFNRRSLVLCGLLSVAFGSQQLVALDGNNDATRSAVSQLATANGLLHRGLYELAIPEFQKYLEQNKTGGQSIVARYGLGVCYYRLSKFDESLKELEPLRTQKEFEFAAEVAAMCGHGQLAKNDWIAAADAFSEVVQKFGKHELAESAEVGLIDALYAAKQWDQARTVCDGQPVPTNQPELRLRRNYLCAMVDVSLNRCAAALTKIKDIKATDKDRRYVASALSAAGACFLKDNSLDEAGECYSELLPENDRSFAADALFGLAQVRQRQGRWSDASELLERLTNLHADAPTARDAQLQLGFVYLERKELSKATEVFESIVRENDDRLAPSLFYLAKCDLESKRVAQAVDRLTRFIAEFPNHEWIADARFDLAVGLSRLDKPESAQQAWADFLTRHGDLPLASDAAYWQSATNLKLRKWPEARSQAQAFLAEHPSHPLRGATLLVLADAAFSMSDFAEARNAYEQAAGSLTDSSQQRYARLKSGLCLHRSSQWAETVEALSPLVNDAPAADQATLFWTLGDACHHLERWADVETWMSKYLGLSGELSDRDDALMKLGLSRVRRGQPEVESFERILREFAQSAHYAHAQFEKGQSLALLGRNDEAAEVFQRIIAENNEPRLVPLARKHLSSIALGQGSFTEAIDLLRNSIASEGAKADESTHMKLIEALIASNNFAEAESELARLRNDGVSKDSALRATAMHALCFGRLSRHEQAMELFGQVEKAGIDTLNPQLRDIVRFEFGQSLRAVGNESDATRHFSILAEGSTDPSLSARALVLLADLSARQGDYAKSLEHLDRLDRVKSEHPDAVSPSLLASANYRRGVSEFELGRFETAVKALQSAVETLDDPTSVVSAHQFLGESLFRLEKYEAACKSFLHVVEKSTDDVSRASSQLRLGECLAKLQRWRESENAFAAFLRQWDSHPSAYQARFGIGWARENDGRVDEAMVEYRTVVEMHQGPTAARAQFQIGECLFAKKQWENAARELLKVDILYSYPEWSAAALFEAGRCFEAMGKPTEARAQFDAVVGRFASTVWAEKARAKLASAGVEKTAVGTK